jgi:3'(2'), 5'-bisphosphate nucleotidase
VQHDATTESDDELAARLATEAGRLLVEVRQAGPADLGAAGDAAAHEWLMRELGTHRPMDRVVSEESQDRPAGVGSGRCWIIDPLDGTREYAEGRDDWAVHVCLVVDRQPTVGAVALPARGITLATGGPLPAPATPQGPVRFVVSRTRATAGVLEAAGAMGAEVVPCGSAGAKVMAVVLGEAEVYAHDGGMYEWDSAAPVAVALAAGFHATRLDGTPLLYDAVDPWLPDLLVCRPDLASQVLVAMAGTAP